MCIRDKGCGLLVLWILKDVKRDVTCLRRDGLRDGHCSVKKAGDLFEVVFSEAPGRKYEHENTHTQAQKAEGRQIAV